MLIYSETSFAFIRKCEKYLRDIIQNETDLTMRKTRFLYQGYLYPIHIVVFEGENKLGYFNPGNNQIGLNKVLLYSTKEKILKDILRHEFAHYITLIKFGSVKPHGDEFIQICEKYNWPKEVSDPSINLEEFNAAIEGDLNSEKIMNKIKNLLKLASSDNPHEAELATIKANQLLLKHNIEYLNLEEANKEFYVHTVLSYKRKNTKMGTIYSILKFFMVSPVLNYTKDGVSLEVTGTKSNIELAEYIAHFLDTELERLWNITKKEKNLKGQIAKNSFYRGIEKGYSEKMEKVKGDFNPSDSKALIKINQELSYHVSKIYGGLRSSYSKNQIDQKSQSLGINIGKSLNINKGLKNTTTKKLIGWFS